MLSTPNPRPSAWLTFAVCAGLVLGTFALFSRALPYDFTNFDDPAYLLNNPHVQGGLSWSGVHWAFTGKTDYWHPLTWLSHMLDWQLYGANATGHRVTSVLWHALNAVLVLLFLRRITGAWWTSVFCAALFAWHPLRVESVIWMPERKDVMSGCFSLLTLWSYVRYAEKREAGAPGVSHAYALTLAMFLGALMCKPVMVALPGVLVLFDFWPLRRLPWPTRPAPDATRAAPLSWRSHGIEKAPFFALSLAVAGVTLVMQREAGALTSLRVSLVDRIGNALVAIPRYLGDFFWPVDLAVIYPHPGAWPVGLVIISAAIVAALTGLAIGQWRRRPWIATGWGWFLLMLAPSIGLVQAGLQARADRYTYVPVIGLQLALLWTLRERWTGSIARWISVTAAALVLAGCAARTWDQQKVWRDPTALFTHALSVTSDNYAAHAFLSFTVLKAGQIEAAETHVLRAIALQPDCAIAHDVLGMIRTQQGRNVEAIASLRRVLEINPRLALTHSDLGELFLREGRPDEAAASWQAALVLNPEMAQAHLGLGELAYGRGNLREAIVHYEQVLALVPDSVEAHNKFAALLAATGRQDEASAHFAAAIKLAPDAPELRFNYATLLREAGRPAEAVEQARAAIGLRPADPLPYLSLALGLEQLGRGDEAAATYARALTLRPGFAPTLCAWGEFLVRRHQPEVAREQFAAALLHDPQFSAAHAGFALVAQQLGRPDDMVAHLRRAVEINPGDPALRRQLGDALVRNEKVAEGAVHYGEAVRLRPGEAELHARLGFAMMILRRPAEAIQAWENALRLNPDFPDLRARIAQARQQLAGGQ